MSPSTDSPFTNSISVIQRSVSLRATPAYTFYIISLAPSTVSERFTWSPNYRSCAKSTQLPLYVVLTECQNLKSFLQLLSTTIGPQLGDSPPLCPGIVSKGYPF